MKFFLKVYTYIFISVLSSLYLYIYLFGQHSIRKYFEKEVIVINHDDKPPILPPGKPPDMGGKSIPENMKII